MVELMPKKIREIKAMLLKEGYSWRAAKGSHTRWTHPLVLDDPITIAGKDGADAPRYLEKQVDLALRRLKKLKEES